jgi:hypothetical protein
MRRPDGAGGRPTACAARTSAPSGPADVVREVTRRCPDAIAIISDPSHVLPDARFLDITSAADIGRDELTPDADGALTIHKFVLQVPRGDGVVSISVAPSDRATVGLSYDPRQWATGMLKIHDASQRVTVERCAGGDAQYNGGFVVHGARCVHLQVQDRGDSDARRLSLPFGTTDCA